MEDLQREASRHISKVEQTCEYLKNNKLNDPQLPDRKKQFIQKDVDAMEFLLEYAKEALVQRGIKV
jgi:hypothetical protein